MFAVRAVLLLLLALWVSLLSVGGAALPEAGARLVESSVPSGVWASVVAEAWPQTLLGIYCGLIVIGSLAGGWLPTRVKLTHTRMQLVVSFVGGLMLGIGVFHLLPHAIAESGSVDAACRWMMAGMLAMFLLIRAFHVHHHGSFELPDESGTVVADSYQHRLAEDGPRHDHDHDHDHECRHAPVSGHSGHSHSAAGHQPHRLSWFGIALGLGLHTFIDGIALGASVQADVGHDVLFHLLGLGAFVAIFLHKPLDAVSITSLMAAAGWSTKWQHAVNVSFALLVPVGASAFLFGVHLVDDGQQPIIGAALAFSAGVFICISLGDLLPEMEFHKHSRVSLTLALGAGILLAWAITFLEPTHVHSAPPASGASVSCQSPTRQRSIGMLPNGLVSMRSGPYRNVASAHLLSNLSGALPACPV